MNHCSECGAENLTNARFCARCGGSLQAAPVQEAAPPLAFSPMRGMAPAVAPPSPESFKLMRGMDVIAVPRQEDHSVMRGVREPAEVSAGVRLAIDKTPGLALFLSFLFPGGGQFYNGDAKKGFVLLALAFVAYLLTVEMGIWFLGIPLSLGAWVWAMMDAGKVARRQKELW